MSDYDPTDILSGCTLRIRTALEALYKNPQNNFKLFIDGDCIYGGSKSTLNDKKISELKLEKFFLREKENNLTPYKQEEKNEKLKGNNISFDILRPLILETAQKVQSGKPENMQTGPAKRGDAIIIRKHLTLLKNSAGLKRIYKLLSSNIEKDFRPRL